MIKNIAHVRGIKCRGAHIGIKSNRKDLAIIYSTVPASAAAVFTTNKVIAEPLKISKKNVANGVLQAFVINSGNANACTGDQGYNGALAMLKTSAECLKVAEENVLIASTGVIGEAFPTDKIVVGIRENAPLIDSDQASGSLVANAILTTDTFAKEGFTSFQIENITINMGGVAKGSGMIHPNMATMLAYLVCDVAIDSKLLQKALKQAVDKTFNMITVDGDTSTNDMVAIMCNGLAGNEKITEEDAEYEKFYFNLEKLCTHLAKLIVTDGEGATKFIEYRVQNARSYQDAYQIVRTISNSNLVKTAMFGRDPNWGRIIAAAGRSGVDLVPEKLDLYFGFDKPLQILKNGQPIYHEKAILKKVMSAPQIQVTLDLNLGEYSAKGWGSDLSYDYVRINAEYTT